MGLGPERRRQPRTLKYEPQAMFVLVAKNAAARQVAIPVHLLDVSDRGCQIHTQRNLTVGAAIFVDGEDLGGKQARLVGRVTWCREDDPNGFKAGVEFETSVFDGR